MELIFYRILLYVVGTINYAANRINFRFSFYCSDLRKAIQKIHQSKCWHLRLHNRPSYLREGQLDFLCPDCKLFETGKTLKSRKSHLNARQSNR